MRLSKPKNRILSLALILLSISTAFAQDPQFSQIYAMPMHLNPAFTGTSELSKAYLNYRNQYPEISHPYVSTNFAIDYHPPDGSSGLGLTLSYDNSGAGDFSRTKVGFLYAYHLQVSKEYYLSAGTRVDLAWQRTNFNNLIFGDQITNGGTFSGNSAEPFDDGETLFYPDLNLGILLSSKTLWVGLAADHINRPNQSYLDNESNLPIKYSLHGGYKFAFINHNGRVQKSLKEFSITPMFMFWQQGSFSRLELGTHILYEPMMFGIWYRGIPIGENEAGYWNQDAVVLMVGYHTGGFNIGYSYDITINQLAGTTGGAHEITLTVDFSFYQRSRSPTYRSSWPNPRM